MIVSYYPKKGNHLLIITAAHKDTDVCIKDVKKKIDFCNSQRCWLDVVKVMLKDYNFEPILQQLDICHLYIYSWFGSWQCQNNLDEHFFSE